MQNTLEQLLEEISFRRKKDLRAFGTSFLHMEHHNTTYWTDLFVRHFLFQTDYEVDRDDLLFFIRKIGGSNRQQTLVEVFRRDSRKLPIGDPDVDWEETIYLNLIVHQLDFTITLAICSRTSPKDLQVLRRHTQKVYATPSRRKMDSKGDSEEMTYPHICFSVDNFDEIFNEVVVRDGETIGIELTATDPKHESIVNTVLFSASIPYETIKRVHEARTSQTVRKRLSQTNLFSLFSTGLRGGKSQTRVEYVRLVGANELGGHAEMAIAKSKEFRGGCETPSSEPGMDLLDLWDLEDDDTNGHHVFGEQHGVDGSTVGPQIVNFKRTHHRRLSDPSSTINDFMRLGTMDRPSNVSKNKSTSESDGIDSCGDATCEVFAGNLIDELEESKYNPLWTMPGYTQIFHTWRESKRIQSVPMQSFVTYVMLPWWSIIRNVLDKQQEPLLTF